MIKKTVLFLVLVFASCYFPFTYYKQPTSFPTTEELLHEINRYNSSAKAQHIEALLGINAQHYFVPFTTDDGKAAMSFWKWEKGKWRLVQFGTNKIKRWQLDEKDPTTSYLVWHSKLQQEALIQLYYIRERNFLQSGDAHYYSPRIVLAQPIQVTEDYGVVPIDPEWKRVLNNLHATQLFDAFGHSVEENGHFAVHYRNHFDSEESTETYITGHAHTTIDYLYYVEENEVLK